MVKEIILASKSECKKKNFRRITKSYVGLSHPMWMKTLLKKVY